MAAKPIAVAAKPLSERVHWIGALDPDMRTFDVILRTPNGTTYNAYAVRGSEGVAVIDTVKQDRAEQFFASLESVARYDEIRVIVLNHLEPDHSGALPELMRRAPQARLYISESAQLMLKSLLKNDVEYTPVTTGDRVSLGDRTLRLPAHAVPALARHAMHLSRRGSHAVFRRRVRLPLLRRPPVQ